MGSKGSVQTTSNTTSAPNPQAAAAYSDVLQRAQAAAGTPYQAYTGQRVADLNTNQNAAFGTIANAQGAYQPYLNSASGYATIGAAPITAQDMSNYANPWQQQVVNATMGNLDENDAQQRTALTGNAISSNAFGGDRAGIAQAELSRQQNLARGATLGSIESQGFNTALSAAQADKARAGVASGQFSNLAGQSMSLPIQGAQAQLQAGNQQQQQSQNQLNVPYQDWQQQQAFPYQQAQWLAGVSTGVGSQMGGTSSNIGTQPAPNPWNTILGGGIAAAGVAGGLGWKPLAANGGRINSYASGGLTVPGGYTGGWIPQIGITAGHGAPTAQATPFQQQPQSNVNKTIGDAVSMAGKIRDSRDPDPGSYDKPLAGLTSDDYESPVESASSAFSGVYANGGDVLAAIRNPRGGIYLPQRFAGGGAPMDIFNGDPGWDHPDIGPGVAPSASLADRFGAVSDAVTSGDFDPQGANYTPFSGTPGMAASTRGIVPVPRSRPNAAPVLAEDDGDDEDSAPKAPFAPKAGVAPPSSAMAFAPSGAGDDMPARRPSAFDVEEGHWLSPAAKNAMLSAGLGMMASRSPYLGVALGEGGQQGLATYGATKKGEVEAQQAADKLSLEAKKSASDLALRTQQQVETGRHNVATEANAADKSKFVPVGSIMGDDGSLHPAVMDQYTGKVIDSVTGKSPKDTDKVNPKGSKTPVSDDDAKALANYYVKTGDASRLNGLGITGEARQKVQHYVTDAQKQLGITDEELATRKAEWEGRKAGQRTLGVQEAKMGSAAFEAEGAIKQARGVIEKLPRTSFLPFNQLAQGYSSKTLNPDQAELYGRTQAIINTYSAVMARGANVTTDSARGHAEALLNTASNPEVFNRMLDTMLQEIEMAKHSPAKMREFYRQQYGAKAVTEPAAETATGGGTAAASTSDLVRQNGHTYKRGPDGAYTLVQ